MADQPTCGACGSIMTRDNARLRPELFLHDACLPDGLRPAVPAAPPVAGSPAVVVIGGPDGERLDRMRSAQARGFRLITLLVVSGQADANPVRFVEDVKKIMAEAVTNGA